ncbi:hypothetical protein [Streptomyces luteireticuli]|uniref:Uncharacterized protein n=1 Tax=Streptomyces luteireticuli TaxID=173858 RepID=A0ABP3IJ23_9ACTN
MRDAISRALEWALRLLLRVLRPLLPPSGRHRAIPGTTALRAPRDYPVPPVPTKPGQHVRCTRGWNNPIPVHVLKDTMPAQDKSPLVRPYVVEWEKKLEERERVRQRRVALVAATLGFDVRYDAPGLLTASYSAVAA